MNHSKTGELSGGQFRLLAGCILLLSLGLRVVGTMRLPLFLDEAFHIYWAQRVLAGDLFIGFEHNKWLYPVALAVFQPLGPEGPWLARIVSALAGVIGTAAVIGLGRELSDRRAGLIAGLLYALLPMMVFHERQALVDPLLAMFTTLALLLIVRLTHRPRLGTAALLALALSGAYLTKAAALPYLVLPPLGALILARSGRDRWRALALGLAAALSVPLVTRIVTVTAKEQGVSPRSTYQVNLQSIGQGAGVGIDPARLLADLGRYWAIMGRYLGWVVIGLVLLCIIWWLVGERRRAILFLAIPALGFALAPILADRPAVSLMPRYLLSTAPPLIVLGALSLSVGLARLRERGRWIGALILAGALAPALWFDGLLMIDPARAPLVDEDVGQYTLHGTPSGYGREALATVMREAWEAGEGAQVNGLIAGGNRLWFDAYLGPRVGEFVELRLDDPFLPDDLARWLAGGDQVYFLEAVDSFVFPAAPLDARLELVAEADSGEGRLRLYRVTGVGDELADRVIAARTPGPEKLAGDAAPLAAALTQEAGIDQVWIAPANQAVLLDGLARLDVHPVTFSAWPLDRSAADAALAGLEPWPDGARIDVVLADEAAFDPSREFLLALQRRFYHLGDDWFGLLHRWRWVSGPSDPPLAQIGAEFEGGITLVDGAVLDASPPPGGLVRAGLAWETPVEIRDSFVVFVHVIDSGGNLRAQHDGVPGGGLLPMTGWQPGQAIIDRVAIQLPPDLEPGTYDLRVGIYFPETGTRLAVEDGGDSALLGRITVGGGD